MVRLHQASYSSVYAEIILCPCWVGTPSSLPTCDHTGRPDHNVDRAGPASNEMHEPMRLVSTTVRGCVNHTPTTVSAIAFGPSLGVSDRIEGAAAQPTARYTAPAHRGQSLMTSIGDPPAAPIHIPLQQRRSLR